MACLHLQFLLDATFKMAGSVMLFSHDIYSLYTHDLLQKTYVFSLSYFVILKVNITAQLQII